LHIGKWLTTWHNALRPHDPGHGSLHFVFIQARLAGQSEFRTHSGLHPSYGLPVNTRTSTVKFLAYCIRAARRRNARINWYRRQWYS